MKDFLEVGNDEEGFVLILCLMILLVLTLLGVAANNTAVTEMLIAGNDSLQKKTFYRADGGTEVASSVLEENIACISGFTANNGGDTVMEGMVRVYAANAGNDAASLNFWQNPSAPPLPVEPDAGNPQGTRTFYYPDGYQATGAPHTNITIGGQAQMTTGSALQMAAGYEGKGKGIGAGGAHLLYDVYSQQVDVNNAEAIIHVQWRHTIGQEGDCFY